MMIITMAIIAGNDDDDDDNDANFGDQRLADDESDRYLQSRNKDKHFSFNITSTKSLLLLC